MNNSINDFFSLLCVLRMGIIPMNCRGVWGNNRAGPCCVIGRKRCKNKNVLNYDR